MEFHMKSKSELTTIPHGFEWWIGLGVLLMIFGGVALSAPIATSTSLGWIVGAMFLAGGVAQAVHAFRMTKVEGSLGRYVLAALSIFAGLLTMRNPVAGMAGITLVLSFYLLLSAVGKWILASELRPESGWSVIFMSSLVSLVLGVILLVTFPVSSLVAPALFFGVEFVASGASCVAIAFLIRSYHKKKVALPSEEKREEKPGIRAA